jgi:glycosyltransferase involved in cell wall biosynthesis
MMETQASGMATRKDLAVLHIALDPVTGPWSVMRELALAQERSGHYAGVGIGVIHSQRWPDTYRQELAGLGLPFFCSPTITTFGTGQFLWQRLRRPPLGEWIAGFAEKTGARRVICHFHNAWMSGVYLPLPPVEGIEVQAVSTFHGVNATLGEKPLRHAAHRWMARRLQRFAASLTSVDASNLALARDLLGLDAADFAVIPNGVPAPQQRSQVWTGEGEFVVGQLGSVMERKGWRIAAEAVQRAAAGGRRIRFLIAGSGPDEEEARQVAADSGGVIEYLGHVAKPAVAFLPRLHALAVMSRHEGLPMSIIESLAAGVPVLATAVGGIPDLLGDGRAGILLERSPEALHDAICHLYDHPDLQQRLSHGGEELFRARFEISAIVAQYDTVYSRLTP